MTMLFYDRPTVAWTSERPNANGHFWRIWDSGHVEVLPSGWIPGDPDPAGSLWLTHNRLTKATS